MGVFDSFADSPEQIRIEGEQITLRFDRTGPTTGRVSWNIPPPGNGCTADTQAYCGMLVTLDTKAASLESAPSDDIVYTSDPTADFNLHAGDRIGDALVIGAFYEGEKKGTGEDLTTFFDISGLSADTAYYISGYAADCVNRYHRQGVFAYSQNLGSEETPSTSGTQQVLLTGDPELTDGTGLELGQIYTLPIEIDGVDYTVTIDGTDAQTYADLIEALNNALEQLTPAQTSPVPPNQNAYYYDTDNNKLYQWDGTQHVEIPVLAEPTDPTALSIGNYWYDTANSQLNKWDGAAWNLIPDANIISYSKDLTDPSKLDSTDYWYNSGSPSSAYQWCGNTWCEKTLYDQTADPTDGITPDCGTYWYNTSDMLLRSWNDTDSIWQEANAIYWNVDPNSLASGTHWFDEINNLLYSYGTPTATSFDLLGFGHQSINLNAGSPLPTNTLTDLALAVGTYTDDVLINGNTISLKIEICDAIEGQFGNVFAEINKQLKGGSPEAIAGTIGFIGGTSGQLVRIYSTTTSAPVIQGGGTLFNSLTNWASNGASVSGDAVGIGDEPTSPIASQYWVDTVNEEIYQRNVGNTEWDKVCSIFFPTNPADRSSCDLWWNSDTDVLSIWDSIGNVWKSVSSFVQSATDPAAVIGIEEGALWHNDGVLSSWDGSTWNIVSFVSHPTDPTSPILNDVWFDSANNLWYEYDGTNWVAFNPVESADNPSQATIPTGTFWYDTMNDGLFMWNGTNWVSVAFGTEPLTPQTGEYWYNTTTNMLMEWNGTAWVETEGLATVTLDEFNNLLFTSSSEGSESKINLDNEDLLRSLTAYTNLAYPVCGTDGLHGEPMYVQEGIGTDGSADERRHMADVVRRHLGYPVVDVELDKEQINLAINIAIEELRRRSSSPYNRGFMKIKTKPGVQRYQLSNSHPGYTQPDGSIVGYDHIVQVMGAFRTTSAFMTSAHGSGVYGQIVLQHLYNMGTFDLLSYHLVSQYIEQLEHLFASRLTFNWEERTRTLWLHQAFHHHQTILLDVAVERTEQDLLLDRFTKRWIEKYATAQSKMFLSQIRGKYATLPGAGGGVSLNAADLMQQAEAEMEELIGQIDNYQVNNPEVWGQNSEFIIG